VIHQHTQRRLTAAYLPLLALFLTLGISPEILRSGVARAASSDDDANSKTATTQVLTVNSSIRYQTWSGWEATPNIYGNDLNVAWFPDVRDEVVYRSAEMGVSQVRMEAQDNWDNGNGTYNFTEFDRVINQVVKPLRDELLFRRGETLKVNVCNVSFGSGAVANHPHRNPTTFANFAYAFVDRAARFHGLSVAYFEICLEPDNSGGNTIFNSPLAISNAVNAVRTKLNATGYSAVKLIAPSCVNATTARNWMQTLQSTYGTAYSKIAVLSYHRYSSASQSVVQSIGDIARTSNKQSAMNEYLTGTYSHLYTDIVYGRVSIWQKYGLGGGSTDPRYINAPLFRIDDSNPNNVLVTDNVDTPRLRQYYSSIRPGAVRVAVTGSPNAMSATAWTGPSSKFVVLVSSASIPFQVAGLPSGNYEVSWVVNNVRFVTGIFPAVNGRVNVTPPSGAQCVCVKKV